MINCDENVTNILQPKAVSHIIKYILYSRIKEGKGNYFYCWVEEKINDNYYQTKYGNLIILIIKNYVLHLKTQIF